MKKTYTILLFLMTFTIFLISQVLVDKSNIWASFKQKNSLVEIHYNGVFKDIVLGENQEEKISLGSIKSDIVIINFWASWCTPCIFEIDSLTKLRDNFTSEEMTILSVNGDNENNFSRVQKIISELKVNFPIITDSSGELFEKFLVDSLPFSLVYYKGKILEVIKGKRDFTSSRELLKFNNLLKATL